MMSKATYVNDRVGDLRPSQLLYTYGIGSIVDLQRLSVMVLGLDDWDEHERLMDTVEEPRLLAAVRGVHPDVTALKRPPAVHENRQDLAQQNIGVPVAAFPRWLRCGVCHRIAPIASDLFAIKVNPYRPDEAEYVHKGCLKAKHPPRAFPVRFLVACENGHLDDFPWDAYVHRGGECPTGKAQLELSESGSAGEAADVWVTCKACDARRPMAQAFQDGNGPTGLMACTNRSPHLRSYDADQCGVPMKPIVLGASHLWFPRVYSALHIPSIRDEVDVLVDQHQEFFSVVGSAGDLAGLRKFRAREFPPELAQRTDAELWDALERLRTPDSVANEDPDLPPSARIKLPEWEALVHPDAHLMSTDFRLRRAAVPEGFQDLIESVVLIDRLREVRAFIGFNRLRSTNEFGDATGAGDDHDRLVSIRRPNTPLTWVPATDVRGEGIFVQFREDAVRSWEDRVWNTEWANRFRVARDTRLKRQGISVSGDDRATLRKILVHSFSHALMRQFALESGYAAASLQERTYALAAGHGGAEMAGILIYTAASDSEGTLGGLIRLGDAENLPRLIAGALESMEVCSTDPLCSEHGPDTDEGRDLHGAACHTCLFAPETSCEMGNQWLDRSALVEGFAQANVAFFGGVLSPPTDEDSRSLGY